MPDQPFYRLLSNISFNAIPYSRQCKDQDILSKEKSEFAVFHPVSPFDLSFEPESLQVFNHKRIFRLVSCKFLAFTCLATQFACLSKCVHGPSKLPS